MTFRHWAASAASVFAALVLAGCQSDSGMSTQKEFVGSEKCSTCHKKEYDTWKDTYHSKMVRSLKDGLLKDAGDNWAKDSKGNAGPTKGNIDGNAYGQNDVQYVIGSLWKQRYIVKNPGTGNHQFLDKQWNRYLKVWEPYGQKNDWETQCATCHSTGYKVVSYDPANPATQKVSMSEHNTGCEACHGPGAAHVGSPSKANIFNPRNASKADASKVCGYCHQRTENYRWKTAQNHPREDMPHPVMGQSYKAGQDDWTKWYTKDQALMVGVQPNAPFSDENKGTDLFNAFWQDDQAKATGLYDERKHHQEYQGYIQSKHSKSSIASCQDCHSPHAVGNKPKIDPRATCTGCHGSQYDWQKIMPGTGQTAGQLFVRTHTFNPKQARTGGATDESMPAPEYFYKK